MRARQILIVDDNEAAADMLGELLLAERPDGFLVEVAYDGSQALRTTYRRRPDTVVMDIDMPVMGGFAAASEMRRLEHTKHAHLIAVSGRADHIDRVRMNATSFHHGLIKPFDFDELVGLIDAGVDGGH